MLPKQFIQRPLRGMISLKIAPHDANDWPHELVDMKTYYFIIITVKGWVSHMHAGNVSIRMYDNTILHSIMRPHLVAITYAGVSYLRRIV